MSQKVKSVAVLGLGKYGKSLAESLYSMGADVMVVDKNPELIEDFSSRVTTAICADLSDEMALRELGLGNMDIVAVAMGQDLAPSIMSVFLAKELGVPFVLAKASSDRMATILKRVGADRVIDPEGQSGTRSARILLSSSFLDFFQMDDLSIVEVKPKSAWVGKTLRDLELRAKHGVNVIAVRRDGIWKTPDPFRPLKDDENLLILAEEVKLKDFEGH